MTDPRDPQQPGEDRPDASAEDGTYELAHPQEDEAADAPRDAETTRPAPPPAPTAAGVRCAHCRYDLSGTPLGGTCPECGTPVAETIRRLQQAQDPEATNNAALTCLVLGALSIPCCSLLGPVAIFFYARAQSELKAGGYSSGSRTLATVGVILGAVGTLRMIAEALVMTFRLFT